MRPANYYFSLKTFVILVVILTCSKLHSQTQNDTILASRYYKKADSLYKEGKNDKAIEYYKKALPIYQKVNVWNKIAGCYNGISRNQTATFKSKKALLNAQKALKISTTHLSKYNKEKASAYDNIGRYYMFGISDYDSALQEFKKALDIRTKTLPKNHHDFIQSYTNIGHIYLNKQVYDTALNYFKKALAVGIKIYGKNHQKITSSYTNISRVYVRNGEYDKLLYYANKVLNIRINTLEKDHPEIGYAYGNVGIAYYYEGYYEKALYYFEKSFAIEIKTSGENNINAANHYRNISHIHEYTGNYNKALQYAKKALSIKIKLLEKNHIYIADSYIQIGHILHQQELDTDALNYYKKALEIYTNTFENNHPKIRFIYHKIGNAHRTKEEYNEALKYYEKALTLETEINSISNLYGSIGQVYTSQKLYDKALTNYNKALDIRSNTFNDSNFVFIHVCIGNIFEKKKMYKKALFHYEKALTANLKPNINTINENTFSLDRYIDLNHLLTTFKDKARVLTNKYQDGRNLEDLITSMDTYKNADSLINTMRQTIDSYEDKITFAKESQEIYSNAVKTNLLMYETSRDNQFLNKAFYYAEKNKSNILKELLIESNTKKISGLTPELVELEKDLRTNRAFYQSKITKEQFKQSLDTAKVLKYESKILNISRRQDSMKLIIEKNHSNYYQLRHQKNIISVAEIQQKLDKRTTVLEFFTTDSITYAFTISKNNIDINMLQTPRLAQKIKQLHDAITSTNLIKYKKSAHTLYNELIAPIANKFKGDHLIIIPDGPLWTLNFELLLTQNGTSDNAKELSYFLKDYAISYANSAHLLFTPFKKKQQSKIKEECLAFSFSDSTSIANTNTMRLATFRDVVDDLPGTRKEIRAISDIIDGQYYFGSQATERNFKKTASQYNILHLAVHGEVDNEHPENSKLYFTQSKDSIEDNILYSHELFALDIPAELTVLSACETGSGKIAKGEGIMSLGNAFQYAGTKSLLLTSWKISDKTTPKLMTYFYTNLKNGMTKSKALQQAKLKYLNTSDIFHSDPLYWGGFYLVGDTTPIQFSSSYTLYWIIGFIILGILLLSLLLYKRKLNRISQ